MGNTEEPRKGPEFDLLAVHLESFNAIAIFNFDKKYHLAMIKHFDGHFSNHSYMHCVFDVFDTYKQAQDFFQEMVESLKTGESVFDLRPRADLNSEKKEKKEKKGGYL